MFFKTCKSLLRLTRECQSISYDAMSAWVSVVFARYVMLAYLNRLDVDERTTGELFYSVCDELADITLLEAFELLMRVGRVCFGEAGAIGRRPECNARSLPDLSSDSIEK